MTPPARTTSGGDHALVIYRSLRVGILSGRYVAGDVISQVGLAREHGVSRGPIREAFRLLQQEGLIDAEVNHRARVAALSPEDVEGIYAQRILIESLAVTASVPEFAAAELELMRQLVEEMDRLTGVDVDAWTEVHTRFHRLLVAHAGERLQEAIEFLFQHSERYRRVYLDRGPRLWTAGIAEHHEILEACEARDAALAGARLGQHLSRTATTVLLTIAPEHDATLIRLALRQLLADAPAAAAPTRPRRSRPGATP